MIFLSICEYINFHDVPAGFNAVLTFHSLKRGKTYVDYNKQPRVVGK